MVAASLGWLAAQSEAAPAVGISQPADGARFIAGASIPLMAVVTNDGAVITGLDFLANGSLLGPGQPDPHGEWDYADGSHLSVMRGMFGESMDYSAPGFAEFFMLEGQYITPGVFVGEFFSHGGGSFISGSVIVTLTFTADGKLNAVLDGAAPLGKRTLSAGVRFGQETPFTFTWPMVAAGSYTLEAVAKYGASQTVASAPVHITVVGGKPHGSAFVQNLTATATHGSDWNDQEQQLGLSWNGPIVAWHASTKGTNDINTNRIYVARSTDNGVTFQPWTLVKAQDDATFTFSPQWMAVDGSTVHLITISHASADDGQRLEYYRSTDGGETFEPLQLLGHTAFGENFNHALIAASEGKATIAVSFSRLEHPNTIKFIRSTDAGATWQGYAMFTNSVASIDLAELHQSGNNVTLTWDSGEASGFWFDGTAHIACSSDAGATFTITPLEDRPVGFAGGNHMDKPRAAREGTNVVALFIRENITGTPTFGELFLRRSTDAGVTFGGPVNLAPGMNNPDQEVPADGQFDVTLDGTNVCVVFGTTDNQLYLTRSVNGGASFSAPVLLADRYFNQGNPAGFSYPRLIQEPNAPAKMHLFWGGAWYARSTNSGVTWTPPVNLMIRYSGWLLAPAPQVAADYSGGLHWAQYGFWNASTDKDWDVLYRRFAQAAAPAGSLNFAAQFAQDGSKYVRFDNLQIPGVPALDFTNALSIECWVKLDPATLNADLVVRDTASVVNYSIFRLAAVEDGSGNRWFQAEVAPAGVNTQAQDKQRLIQPGVWYHLAMTFDATQPADNLKLYLNGDLLGTGTCTEPLPVSRLPIVVSRFLDGAVDDLRFWNRALTAQDIRDRFTGPLAGNEPGLAAYYTFNGTWAESTGQGLPAVPMYQESFGNGADVQPLLHVELAGSEIKLSWVTFGSAYAPQFTSDLGNPNWQPVSGTPQLINGRYTVTLPKSAGPMFFRVAR